MIGAYPPLPRGFTVMEMLAVLTLVSLLATLLVQGLTFFAARYEAVKRYHRAADSSATVQHWFATTVAGVVPVGVRARALWGDASSFSATTLQPLAGEGGVPAAVRWTVAEGESAVLYQEEGLAAIGRDPIAWRLPVAGEDTLYFQYADRQGGWHDAWPTREAPLEWIPMLVRLVGGDEREAGDRTVWIAAVEAAAFPKPNEFHLQ